MRSYAIALLFHCDSNTPDLLEHIQSFRQQLPFASIYLYSNEMEDGTRTALQKMDVTLRQDYSGNRFEVMRRMFTETDADIFVYVGNPDYPAEGASTMIHHLVEGRKDMVSAYSGDAISKEEQKYQVMCSGLFGRRMENVLSDYRAFSRRFVKSFAAFERGFPIELELTMHALELDIPYEELRFDYDGLFVQKGADAASSRGGLSRLVLNFQARPLKWFGLITALFLLFTMGYKTLFLLNYLGFEGIISQDISVTGAASFAVMAFISALSGLLLHSHSHQRRELKRLHFQQHSTL